MNGTVTDELRRKREANLRPVKPGQVLNPKGRPPKVKCIPDILEKLGKEVSEKNGKTNLENLMRSVYLHAMRGHGWALQFIAERTEGKVTDKLQVDDNRPTVIFHVPDNGKGPRPSDASTDPCVPSAKAG